MSSDSGPVGFAAEHYADDLQMDLEDIMLSDFNAELEDDSPLLVGAPPLLPAMQHPGRRRQRFWVCGTSKSVLGDGAAMRVTGEDSK